MLLPLVITLSMHAHCHVWRVMPRLAKFSYLFPKVYIIIIMFISCDSLETIK